MSHISANFCIHFVYKIERPMATKFCIQNGWDGSNGWTRMDSDGSNGLARLAELANYFSKGLSF